MNCINCAGHSGFIPTTSGWKACSCTQINGDLQAILNRRETMTDTKYVHIDWKDMYKDELAQELVTEREKVLSVIEGMVKLLAIENKQAKPADKEEEIDERAYNACCDDVLAKLNQLKEGR